MTVREIITIPNPILRKKAHKVTEFGKEFQVLVQDMIETMREAPGVGLAAPQVGISQRVIVVEYAEYDEDADEDEQVETPKKLYVLVNPEFTTLSEEMVLGIEGCLSVPDLVGEVERHLSVSLKGLNRYGKPTRIKADGWLARIFQHEIDHLDGVVYPDRTDKIWKPLPEDEVPLD